MSWQNCKSKQASAGDFRKGCGKIVSQNKQRNKIVNQTKKEPPENNPRADFALKRTLAVSSKN
jgi:hypothetical protein